jgi:hypothetical protein
VSAPLTRAHRAALIAVLLTSAAAATAQPPLTPDSPPRAPADPAAQREKDKQDTLVLIKNDAAEDGVFSFDWGVPSSPALKLLGQSEDKITVVNGLKPFILQLPRLLGGDNGGQSLGLDVSPAWLLGDRSTRTFNAYTNPRNRLYRIALRTHVGAALYEGVADDDPTKAKPSRVTLGFSTSLLDSSDPLMALASGQDANDRSVAVGWRACIERNADAVADFFRTVKFQDDPKKARLETELNGFDRRLGELRAKAQAGTATEPERVELAGLNARAAQIGGELDTIQERGSAEFKAQYQKSAAFKAMALCPKEANVVAQYGASLNVGAGALWDGTPGKLKGFSSSGVVGWVSFRHPLAASFELNETGVEPASYWMVGFSARASVDELVATGIKATPQVKANVFDGWVGLERLTAASRLGLQLGYQIRDTNGRLADFDRKRWRYFASYSQRLGGEKSGMWLQLGYGHVRTNDNKDEALTVSLIFAPPAAANLFGTKSLAH